MRERSVLAKAVAISLLMLLIVLIGTGIQLRNVNATSVFRDDFENGGFSNWSGSGLAAIVQSPVHAGSYAAKATGPNSYWYENLGSGYSDLFFAGYIQFQSTLSNGQTTLFLYILDASYSGKVAGGLQRDSSGNTRWVLRVNNNLYSSPAVSVQTSQWYFMAIKYSTSGTVGLWVDGSLMVLATGQTLLGRAQIIQGGNPTSVTPAGFISYGDDYIADTSYISPPTTPTPTPSPTPTTVFRDDFENGGFSNWSGSGLAAIVQSPVHAGSYAAKATGPNSYWYKSFDGGYNDFFFAGYIQLQSSLSNGQTTLFLYILDASYSGKVAGGLRVDNIGNARWGLRVNNNWYSSSGSISIQTSQWYFMEIKYSTSGTASLWVDGSLMASATGQTLLGRAQIIQGGNPTSVTPAGFISYGDDYIADTSYISPPTTPTPTPSPTPPPPAPSPWLHTSGVNIYDSNNNQVIWNGVTTPTLFGYVRNALPGGVLLESLSPDDISIIRKHGLNFVRLDISFSSAVYGQNHHYQTPTKLNYYPRFWTLLDSIINRAQTEGIWVEICFGTTTQSGIGGYWDVTDGFPTWMYNGSWSYFNKIYSNDGIGYTAAQRDFWNINDPTAANVRIAYQTFWKDMAYHFKDTPNVVFSLYNEPECGGGFAVESLWGVPGQPSEAEGAQMYKAFMESTIDIIRSQDNGNHVILANLAFLWYWEYNLKIDRPNVVVEGHSYSLRGTDFFNLGWRYNQPFILSEFGGVEVGLSSRATLITQIQTCNQNNVNWAYLRYDRVAPSAQTWVDLQNNLHPNLIYYS